MSTATPEPTVEDTELDLATAEANLSTVRDGIASGAIDDPSELEAAETRRRFALFRRDGARDRAAKAARKARQDALAALADRARATNPTPVINVAYDEFEAAVEAAVAVFAAKVRDARAGVVDVMNEAHALEVPAGRDEAEEGMYRFGTQLHYPFRDGGPDTYIDTPLPVAHGNTRNRLEKAARSAIAAGTTPERA